MYSYVCYMAQYDVTDDCKQRVKYPMCDHLHFSPDKVGVSKMGRNHEIPSCSIMLHGLNNRYTHQQRRKYTNKKFDEDNKLTWVC